MKAFTQDPSNPSSGSSLETSGSGQDGTHYADGPVRINSAPDISQGIYTFSHRSQDPQTLTPVSTASPWQSSASCSVLPEHDVRNNPYNIHVRQARPSRCLPRPRNPARPRRWVGRVPRHFRRLRPADHVPDRGHSVERRREPERYLVGRPWCSRDINRELTLMSSFLSFHLGMVGTSRTRRRTSRTPWA